MVAEALAMRHPRDARHRARLEFVVAELDELGETIEPAVPDARVIANTPGDEFAAAVDDVAATSEPEAETASASTSPDVSFATDQTVAVSSPVTEDDAFVEVAIMEMDDFDAARQQARVEADAGNWLSALMWLERAAATMPTPDVEEELAYEMALVLEDAGEHERALGVLSEIAAKAGSDYRDVAERIRRLESAVRRRESSGSYELADGDIGDDALGQSVSGFLAVPASV
jgi:hypothetical protein